MSSRATWGAGRGGCEAGCAARANRRLPSRGTEFVLKHTDRGQAITAMSEALVAFIKGEHAKGLVAGAIGIGGSGGTALVAPALRALPVGLPKVIVSTLASGNTAPYLVAPISCSCRVSSMSRD